MQSKIQIENAKPVKMVEGLTKVAIDAFPHHCRIEVFAEKENVNIKRLSFLSVVLNFIGFQLFPGKFKLVSVGFQLLAVCFQICKVGLEFFGVLSTC